MCGIMNKPTTTGTLMNKMTGLLSIVLLAISTLGQSIINSEWIDAPFGVYNNTYKGGSSESNGIFTLTGSGAGMDGWSNDGGRFVFKPISGDCDISALIQIPVGSNLHPDARAGIMLRESNDRGVKYISFARLRGDLTNVGRIQTNTRKELRTNPATQTINGYTNEWIKLRIIRIGDTFTYYTSTDLVANVWSRYRQEQVAVDENLNAGIFVTLNNNSAAKLMTNDFAEVSAKNIVDVQTNESDGAYISWLTELPFLPTDSCQYSYSVTRTSRDGTAIVVATDLPDSSFNDNTLVKGTYYKYSINATEIPYLPQASTQTVHVGSSATFRYQVATTNLISGLAPGLTMSYYNSKEAVTPYATANATTLAAVLTPTGGKTTYYKTIVDGCIYVETTDIYTFLLELDDSAEIFIDGIRILNNWEFGGDRWTASAPVKLEQGRAHAFRATYYQASGGQRFNLKWTRAGDPGTLADVPGSAFTPVPAGMMTLDVGDFVLNGNTVFDSANETITMVAGGGPVTEISDSGRAVLTSAGISVDISTCLTSLDSSAPNPMAGVTVRNDLSIDSAGITLLAVGGNGNWVVMAARRSSAGTDTVTTNVLTSIPETAPICLRITQNGSDYTLLYKAESATIWSVLDTFNISLNTASQCGLVATSDALDSPATAVFTGTAINTANAMLLLPTDDTYVLSDNTLHGTDTNLQIKHRGTGTMREALMRFNVAEISALNRATLRLAIANKDNGTPVQDVNLRVHHNLKWKEATLRWNTPPAGLHFPTVFLDRADPTLVARFPAQYTGEFIEIDVTDQVLESIAGTGDLTFSMSATVSIDPTLNFFSKEHADSALRPYLVITTDAPCGFKASGSIQSGDIALQWSSYPGATTYSIYRATAAEGPYSPVASNLAGTTHIDSVLTPGALYHYKVSAVTATGERLSQAASAYATSGAASQIATDDAHVEGDGGTRKSGNKNYGDDVQMTVKSNYGAFDFHREAFIKFSDISGLGHAQQVILKVTPSTASAEDGSISPSQIAINFIRMPDNNWSENTVTFNTPPVGYALPTPRDDSAPATDRVTALATAVNVPMYVDITEIVHKAAAVNSDNKLSIGILRMDNLGAFNLSFRTTEQSVEAYKPTLLYSAVNRPILLKPETSNAYNALMWGAYPNATAYNIYRAASKEGSYTLATNTTATAFNDLSTRSGVVYFYKLTAITNGVESEASLPVASAITLEEARYPVADAGVDGNDQFARSGANTTANMKWSPTRENLFKFDVRGLENITSARFRVNPSPQDSAYIAVNIRLWQSDYGDWNEYNIAFNENYRPINYTPQQSDMANHLATISVEYKEIDNTARLLYAEADVTHAIRAAAQAGMKYLTLIYTGDGATPDGKGYMTLAMREYAGIEKDPVLILSGSTFSAPAGLSAEESISTLNESGVALTWRQVFGVDHYVVTRSAPNGETTIIADNLTATSYTDASTTFRNTGEYTYTVTAVNSNNIAVSSSVAVTMKRTMTMPILADTFVRSGDAYSNDVYGTSYIMEVKRDNNGSSAYNREAFIRIDATNSPAFTKAYLRMVLHSLNTTTDVDTFLMEVADNGWSEANANWITMQGTDYSSTPIPALSDPSLLDTLNLQEFSAGSELVFDITANLLAAKARGDSTFVMHLFNGTIGSETNYRLWSREAANNENIPHVIYTVPKYPIAGMLMIVR